jgi:heat shock protein HtpX
MFKRIGFFFLTNILIMITISVIIRIFNLDRYTSAYGLNLPVLAMFCLIWGFAGAIISLFLSKTMAKMSMGVVEIDGRGQYSSLYQMVQRLSRSAGIPMPEVGVYESPEVNAFATGPSSSNALVAVSTGLLHQMNENEVEAVLGHEIAHVANGDMVTLTLIQGVVNSFGMFLSRIIGYFAGLFFGKSDDENSSPNFIVQYIVTIVFDIIFSILGSMVVAYFSRMREYRADIGGAKYAGRVNMIAALERLRKYSEVVDERGASISSLKISNKEGFLALFSTHPPLEERIKALKTSTIK